MRLLSEQIEQLDKLRVHVQASAFNDAGQLLGELEQRPSPGLIPALLPAFVPEALRRNQAPQGWMSQALSRLRLVTGSTHEEQFREQLAALVARSLSVATASELIQLDESCRRYGAPGWATNHWRLLDARSMESSLPKALDSRVALLGLASFHGSGFVRECSLDLLDAERSGNELPFLLVRLNDWVAPVQQRAFRAVRARIREDYVQHFARWIELLFRLREARRNQLSDVAQWALTLVASPVGRPYLLALFDAKERRLRRTAFRLAGERFTGDERTAALRKALGDRDMGIRLWAARACLESGQRFAEMETDPCGAIRVWALRARVEDEQSSAVPSLRRALFDRAASVRTTARFHLSLFDPELVIADVYRRALDESDDPSTLTAAIAGLAAIGNRDDAALIAFHTSSPSARIAKAALKACGNLARTDCTRELAEALSDRRRGVSKVARLALAGTPLPTALLADLTRKGSQTHTRLNALALAANLHLWDRLVVSLEAVTNDRVEVQNAAQLALERWLLALSRLPYLPIRPAHEQAVRLQELIGAIPDTTVRARTRRAVAGYLGH